MTVSVIALSVMTGSDGYKVAHQVAERLNLRYYDWEITTAAAARAGVSPNDVIAAERVPGFVERMMIRLGAVSASGPDGAEVFSEPSAATLNTAFLSLSSDDYRQVIEKVVVELADQGEAIIVGHGAQFTLKDRPGVLKVLLHGSLKKRAERYAEEQSIPLETALIQVKRSDKERAELLRRVYHFGWLDADMYDLTINTDHLPADYAADAIEAAAKSAP